MMQTQENKQKTSHAPDGKEAHASAQRSEVGHAFASAGETGGKRPKSRGERAFNWLVHGGINLVFNSAISVVFTHWFKHKGKPSADPNSIDSARWDKGVQIFGTAAEKTLGWAIKKDKKWFGETGMGLFLLAVPGWVLLYPITKLEQNKKRAVEWLDRTIDRIKSPSETELQKREVAYQALEHEPKPTGLEMVRNRLAGWLIFNILPTYLINRFILEPPVMQKNPADENGDKIPNARGESLRRSMGFTPHKIEHYTRAGANWLTGRRHKNLDWKNQEVMKHQPMRQILDITGQEIVSCGLTSLGLKKFLDFFRRRKEKALALNQPQERDETLLALHDKKTTETTSEERAEKSHTAQVKKPSSYTERTAYPASVSAGVSV